jgi:signal transduction histidine kinase
MGRLETHRAAEQRGQIDAGVDARLDRRHLRCLSSVGDPQPIGPLGQTRAGTVRALLDERRRMERDLHDGVQNELVVLLITLTLAREEPGTPPGIAEMLAGLEDRAQAALDAVRNIARGIYPPLLADRGLGEAVRAQAIRAANPVRVLGTAPRSTADAEEAVYFACSEALQNVAKHAGPATEVTIRLDHDSRRLTVRITDDGRGFDPAHTPQGAGLRNIRGRIEDLGGGLAIASMRGRGTALALRLPWPSAADGRR